MIFTGHRGHRLRLDKYYDLGWDFYYVSNNIFEVSSIKN